MKDIAIAVLISAAIVASSVVIKTGMENSKKLTPSEAYSLYGYEGVLYRLNNVNGRLDVLVPSNEAALLFPVGQIQLPGANEKLTDDQKKSFSQNIQTLSRYIQSERSRTLGLKPKEGSPVGTKV